MLSNVDVSETKEDKQKEKVSYGILCTSHSNSDFSPNPAVVITIIT